MKIWLTGLCLIVLFSFAQGDDKINVGVVLPLSGHNSNFGIEALKGINLAAEKINEQGGIDGKTLNLLVRDNTGDPTVTSLETTNLINEENVLSIVGPLTSGNSAAAGAVAQQNRTPLVLPVATSPYVTEIGEYICRICFTDPIQSKALAEFSKRYLKAGNIAIVYEKGSPYSEKLAEFFTLRSEDMGCNILFAESFEHNSKSIKSLIDQALEHNPDILFLPVYYPEAITIVNHLAAIGSSITLLGGDGWESTELFRLAGENINPGQVYISSHFSLQFLEKSGSDFGEEFAKSFGGQPSAFSALGYDAIMLLADAIGRATSATRDGIQQALVTTDNFQGVTGPISINEKRNVVKSVYILKALKDGFIFETVIPDY